MASLRQLIANRKNSEKSPGPRTESGKQHSSRNNVQHGLAGLGLALPDEEEALVAARKEAWRGSYRPSTPEQEFEFTQLVSHSVRIESCQAHERIVREEVARRAATSWDDDRTGDAEALGAKLARKPEVVMWQLRCMKQGCNWLIERWIGLGEVLSAGRTWDDAETAVAFDLLGVPAMFRFSDPWPDDSSPRALVDSEIELLEGRLMDGLEAIDEGAREAAELGLPLREDPSVTLIRRYETRCYRLMQAARCRLEALQRETLRAAIEDPTADLPAPPDYESLFVMPTLPKPEPAPAPVAEPMPVEEPPIVAAVRVPESRECACDAIDVEADATTIEPVAVNVVARRFEDNTVPARAVCPMNRKQRRQAEKLMAGRR